MSQKETTREYTREEMREATLNNYNAGWNAAIQAMTDKTTPHWTTRKGWAEYTWPRRGKKPFQWRWMSLKEMLRHRDTPMRLRAMRKRIARRG